MSICPPAHRLGPHLFIFSGRGRSLDIAKFVDIDINLYSYSRTKKDNRTVGRRMAL